MLSLPNLAIFGLVLLHSWKGFLCMFSCKKNQIKNCSSGSAVGPPVQGGPWWGCAAENREAVKAGGVEEAGGGSEHKNLSLTISW